MPASFARSANQLGRLVRLSRQKQGLTQTQLGELAGQRQEMISKIETGQASIKLKTLFDVLAALRLELVVQPSSLSSTADIQDIF